MKARLLAAAILFCVYIGAPFVAPDNHTVYAAQYCFCYATADMYENNGGAYLGQQTNNYNVGQKNSWVDCQNACWHTTFQWGENTVCPSGDIQYLTLNVDWRWGIIAPDYGHIGPINIGCP